ncbi:hypothetical protein H0H81_009704 [Sphagnurus paluster]|uniref:Uncharacterized protein n=1 Tax=Sphagnurus paluster TaxID=117069 RepID=A0A9P7GNI4_9AGAR|nr:hypothetical protein H0H81_009704 [Sphagnurus paluster]
MVEGAYRNSEPLKRALALTDSTPTLFPIDFALSTPMTSADTKQDSSLVAFFKEVYAADSTPGAITFEEAISRDGIFYTNGMSFPYNAISKRFNLFYGNVEINYSEIAEVAKIGGLEGEGTVGAGIHWKGDYVHGGRDEFHSHVIMYIERIDGKQMVTQIFEITDYADKHGIFSYRVVDGVVVNDGPEVPVEKLRPQGQTADGR